MPPFNDVVRVIGALCYLRDTTKTDRTEIERELAFFRRRRHRIWHHSLREKGQSPSAQALVEAVLTNLPGSGAIDLPNIVFTGLTTNRAPSARGALMRTP